MSCSIGSIHDPQTQKNIDKGIDELSVKIKKAVEKDEDICMSTTVDKWANIGNMVIQYVILAFVVLALFRHEKAGLIVKIVGITSIVSLVLLAIQYRNAIIPIARLIGALDTSTKIIIFLSIAAALGTTYIQKGDAGFRLTLAIAMILFVKLSLQMKNFLNDEKSSAPAFLAFVKELFTPRRISTIFRAF